MKIVSVIVPCHNAAKWLPQCFLSLVQQSIGMDALELIFVDDASDDAGETWALLEEFERAYPESIMIIHLEDNLRQGGARNVALGYATGEYPDSDKGGAEAVPCQREDHLRMLEQAVPEIACGAGGRPLCRACHL